jgi:hypothetical protein
MPYKKVKRWITLEFVKQANGQGYDIRVTPEQVIARYGDVLGWDVQGLPGGLATSITFGNFQPLEVPPRVSKGKKGLGATTPKLKLQDAKVGLKNDRFIATVNLDKTDPGYYKYDIMANGRTLLDPDVEIRGPK